MPYIRCPRCGVLGYGAAPWSSQARCANCGAALDIPRRDPVEAEVRDLLYPGPHSVERVGPEARRAREAALNPRRSEGSR